MDRIGEAVEKQLARFDGKGAMPRIVAAWPAAVGDVVARNSWPARVARDGTLHVHTSSSVWAFELGQLAPRILERLRRRLPEVGDQPVQDPGGELAELEGPDGRARVDVQRPVATDPRRCCSSTTCSRSSTPVAARFWRNASGGGARP